MGECGWEIVQGVLGRDHGMESDAIGGADEILQLAMTVFAGPGVTVLGGSGGPGGRGRVTAICGPSGD